MAASIPALVNPAVLIWARQESGYPTETVARRLNVKPERLLAWERGQLKPTVRQARGLAKLYHRPLGVFFLPQTPALPPLATEYRRLPGMKPGVESPEFRLAVRVMSLRREVVLDLSEELGVPRMDFSIGAHLSETPEAVGSTLRSALRVSADEQLSWTSEWQAWRRWREAVEAMGVLVFQFPKVSLDQVRGVILIKFPSPAIELTARRRHPQPGVLRFCMSFATLPSRSETKKRMLLEKPAMIQSGWKWNDLLKKLPVLHLFLRRCFLHACAKSRFRLVRGTLPRCVRWHATSVLHRWRWQRGCALQVCCHGMAIAGGKRNGMNTLLPSP